MIRAPFTCGWGSFVLLKWTARQFEHVTLVHNIEARNNKYFCQEEYESRIVSAKNTFVV